MMRDYNIRERLTSAEDTPPERFFTLPVDGGRLEGTVLNKPKFNAAVDLVPIRESRCFRPPPRGSALDIRFADVQSDGE